MIRLHLRQLGSIGAGDLGDAQRQKLLKRETEFTIRTKYNEF